MYDAAGKTLLASDSAWPGGQFLKAMTPGRSAAFETMTRVPGDPAEIKWRLGVDGCPLEVKRADKQG